MYYDKNNLYHQFVEMNLETVKPEPDWLMAIELVNSTESILNKKDAEGRWEMRLVITPKSLLLKVLYKNPLINLYYAVLSVISIIIPK